jgi:muramidase (phage lysozyme)
MFISSTLITVPLVIMVGMVAIQAKAEEFPFLAERYAPPSEREVFGGRPTGDLPLKNLRLGADDYSFAPLKLVPASGSPQIAMGGTKAARLKSLIATAEAGRKGYDAIHHGARRLPSRKPTQMSLGQILDWIGATPGQPHAVGRYQFIPATLRSLMRRGDIPRSARFSPAMQDHLADMLLADAGYSAFQQGRLSRKRFMNNLARIWAGLPTSSGKSAYHGYAGNRATLTWSVYDREMAAIFR